MEEKGLSIGSVVIVLVLIAIVYGSINGNETNGVTDSSNNIVSGETSDTSTEQVSLDISDIAETDKITVLKSSSDYKYKNYQEVLNSLRIAGFTNIKCEPVYDVFFGILVSEGDSDKVTINGTSEFSKGDVFSKNAEVVITYHLSYTDDPDYETTSTSAATNEAPKSLSYSTNDMETAKDGNTGVFSYKSRGGQHTIYYVIDFDEGYVYRFRNDEDTCERLKMDSGNLNSVLIVTYHDGDDSWQNGLHFKWKNQPDHLILEDNNHFETDFYSTNLSDALRIKDDKTIIDY